MRRAIKYARELEEFKTKGFIKAIGQSDFLAQLRERYAEYLRIFAAGNNNSVGKIGAYGSFDIFGNRICYYYDKRKENDFVDFIVEKFFEKNPEPNMEIRKVFTRILHQHGLCWAGCIHTGKPKIHWDKPEDIEENIEVYKRKKRNKEREI